MTLAKVRLWPGTVELKAAPVNISPTAVIVPAPVGAALLQFIRVPSLEHQSPAVSVPCKAAVPDDGTVKVSESEGAVRVRVLLTVKTLEFAKVNTPVEAVTVIPLMDLFVRACVSEVPTTAPEGGVFPA